MLADWVWPPRSLLSDALTDRPGVIEGPLWAQLRFLGQPCCARCGFPFDTPEPPEAVCPDCLREPPPYACARAAVRYDDLSRKLALDLKRAGRRDGLPVFAAWMSEAGCASLAVCDVIVPTPLHWTRLAQRRFNQAAWLAQAVGARVRKPVDLLALRRVRRRRSQEGLSANQRRRNVAGAFQLSATGRVRLAGKTVLLIDDVFTTGSTLEACTRALLRGGVREVHALTLARVVRAAS